MTGLTGAGTEIAMEIAAGMTRYTAEVLSADSVVAVAATFLILSGMVMMGLKGIWSQSWLRS